MVVSGTTCSYSDWSREWSSDAVEKIYFFSGDDASDFYRPGKSSYKFSYRYQRLLIFIISEINNLHYQT